MNHQTRRLPEKFHAAAERLAESLQASEPFVLYEQASLRLKSDAQAKCLLEQLTSVQAQVRSEQMKGGLTQEALDALRSLQSEVQKNNTIMAHARSQQAAVSYLREINLEISQLLGVDFAGLARQSCC